MTRDGRKTVCFDLDGTICSNTFGDYELAEPFDWAVERVNAIAQAGHRVIVFTARGTATGINWDQLTRGQLERWGVDYDELHFGKPSADVYVDDRAVQTYAWRVGDVQGVPGFETRADSAGEQLPRPARAHLSAVVEVGRTFGGRPFRLAQHAWRVRELALAADIRPLPSEAEISERVTAAVASAADEEDVVFAISLASATHAAFADELEPGALGGGLHVARRPLRHAAEGLARFAAPAREHGVPAIAAATSDLGPAPAAWPLETDETGALSDVMGGQLGVVRDHELVLEPSREPPPVTMEWLAELAPACGLRVAQRSLGREQVHAGDEALLAGLPFCLLGIASLDGDVIGGDSPGPATRELLAAWGREVGIDVASELGHLFARSAVVRGPGGQRP